MFQSCGIFWIRVFHHIGRQYWKNKRFASRKNRTPRLATFTSRYFDNPISEIEAPTLNLTPNINSRWPHANANRNMFVLFLQTESRSRSNNRTLTKWWRACPLVDNFHDRNVQHNARNVYEMKNVRIVRYTFCTWTTISRFSVGI